MFSIQIRVDEGKIEELLEALSCLRQNTDFEFQAANEQHKQSVTDPGTDESGKASKPEKRVESTGRTHNSNATNSSVVVESSDLEDGGEDGKEKEPTPNEIATKLNRWLDRKGVARGEFAKHINRSKSTFADMLSVMLDGIFVNCGGRPEKSTIKRICPTLKLEQRQVNISF